MLHAYMCSNFSYSTCRTLIKEQGKQDMDQILEEQDLDPILRDLGEQNQDQALQVEVALFLHILSQHAILCFV